MNLGLIQQPHDLKTHSSSTSMKSDLTYLEQHLKEVNSIPHIHFIPKDESERSNLLMINPEDRTHSMQSKLDS